MIKPDKDHKFRIRFRTRDGQLVQDRRGDPTIWFYNGRLSEEFAKISLEADCREKGVKLVSFTADKDTGIDAIVTWYL